MLVVGLAAHPPNPLALREGGRFLAPLGMTWAYARNDNRDSFVIPAEAGIHRGITPNRVILNVAQRSEESKAEDEHPPSPLRFAKGEIPRSARNGPFVIPANFNVIPAKAGIQR